MLGIVTVFNYNRQNVGTHQPKSDGIATILSILKCESVLWEWNYNIHTQLLLNKRLCPLEEGFSTNHRAEDRSQVAEHWPPGCRDLEITSTKFKWEAFTPIPTPLLYHAVFMPLLFYKYFGHYICRTDFGTGLRVLTVSMGKDVVAIQMLNCALERRL